MISFNLKSVFRSFQKQKLYSLINVLGLSLAFASALIMILYVRFELSYDRFFPESEHIYRINTYWLTPEGDQKFATAPPPLANYLEQDLPDNSSVTRVFHWSDFTMRPDDNLNNPFRETNLFIADSKFFGVFSEQLIAGNPETALSKPGSIVMTESMAKRYFGNLSTEKILNHNLLGGKDAGTPWQITGIMKDLPVNSHLSFDGLVSAWPEFTESDNWSWNIMHTYLKVNNRSEVDAVNQNLEAIVANHAAPYMGMSASEMGKLGYNFTYVLQPLHEIHLHSNLLREIKSNGNFNYILVFISALVLTLLVAIVNYSNLSIAISSKFAKEVGIRRVMGSSRADIGAQLFLNALSHSLIALLIGFGLAELFLMNTKEELGLKFDYDLLADPATLYLLSIAILTAVLASLLPIIYFTRINPATVLKGKLQTSHSFVGFRNGLTIFQFSISIVLILSALVIRNQLAFIQTKDPGFNKENVLVIQNDREIDEQREAFKDQLLLNPHILNASFSTGLPAQLGYASRDITSVKHNQSFGINWYQADYSMLETLDLELMDGRWFNKALAADTFAVVLNQAAVNELGLQNPIGHELIINQGANDERTVAVVGVVRDFNNESFHNQIKPLVIENLTDYNFKDYIAIRIASGSSKEAFEYIQETWSQFEPDVPFNYSFLDENFDSLFKSEVSLGQVISIYSILSIIIACLGLFGLTSYSINIRKKEISVRKVLGASKLSIISLFSRSYLFLVMVSIILGTLAGSWAMNLWLNSFSYKTNIQIGSLVIPGLIVVLLAVITVSYHVFQNQKENPADVLREE